MISIGNQLRTARKLFSGSLYGSVRLATFRCCNDLREPPHSWAHHVFAIAVSVRITEMPLFLRAWSAFASFLGPFAEI